MTSYIQFLIAVNMTTLTIGLTCLLAFCLYGMYKAVKND